MGSWNLRGRSVSRTTLWLQRTPWRLGLALLVVAATVTTTSVFAEPAELRGPETFDSIEDPSERSRALFTEAGKVLLHPRCVNCHPSGDVPMQGEDGKPHEPWVQRGAGGHGAVGMRCMTCHTTENFDPGRVPGAPNWHLAPASMAWEGRSLAELCEQLKDPERAHMDLEGLVRHMSQDPLVAWAWNPGADRQAPPGSQEQLGELIAAWVATGAACPE